MQFTSMILSNAEVSPGYWRIRLTAPQEFATATPGQFVNAAIGHIPMPGGKALAYGGRELLPCRAHQQGKVQLGLGGSAWEGVDCGVHACSYAATVPLSSILISLDYFLGL